MLMSAEREMDITRSSGPLKMCRNVQVWLPKLESSPFIKEEVDRTRVVTVP